MPTQQQPRWTTGRPRRPPRERDRLRKQKERGGLKRKPVADRDDSELDEDERRIAHFKSIKRASDKRYREKKKAAKAAAAVVGCKD